MEEDAHCKVELASRVLDAAPRISPIAQIPQKKGNRDNLTILKLNRDRLILAFHQKPTRC